MLYWIQRNFPVAYFWARVILLSVRTPFSSQEFGGWIVQTVIALAIAVVLAILRIVELGMSLGWVTIFTFLGITVFTYWAILFLTGLVWYPAKLYLEAKKDEVPLYWDDVIVRHKVFWAGKILRGYKVEITNKKWIPLQDAIIEVRILELDGKSSGPIGGEDFKGMRLLWIIANQRSATWRDIPALGGTLEFILVEFEKDTEERKCVLTFQEPDMNFPLQTPLIENSAIDQMRGEIHIRGKVKGKDMPGGAVYNFAIRDFNSKKPTIIFRKGSMV